MDVEPPSVTILVCLLSLGILLHVITGGDFASSLNKIAKALKLKYEISEKTGFFLYLVFGFIISFVVYYFFLWDQ